jgi:hypothetical protein
VAVRDDAGRPDERLAALVPGEQRLGAARQPFKDFTGMFLDVHRMHLQNCRSIAVGMLTHFPA